MADTQRAFLTRVFSALFGAAIIFSGAFWGGKYGVQVICLFAVILAGREYARMVFVHTQMPAASGWFYRILSVLFFLWVLFNSRPSPFGLLSVRFGLAVVLYCVGTLWMARGRVSNGNLLHAIAAGSFGLVYCVLFPVFGAGLAYLPDGVNWFFFMLIVVFFGDTFAYFSGRWFGKHKFYPDISPNKTWEGAVGGIVGSCVGGVVFGASVFENTSWYQLTLFCIVCGAVEQSGDLLMSLVKRVAHVKDSGSIMPGHGGILDRLDGIFIACPLVYAFALYVGQV